MGGFVVADGGDQEPSVRCDAVAQCAHHVRTHARSGLSDCQEKNDRDVPHVASGNSSSCCRVSRFGPDCFQLVQRPFLWFDQAFYIRSCEEEVFSRRETTAQLELSFFLGKRRENPRQCGPAQIFILTGSFFSVVGIPEQPRFASVWT